MSTNESKAAPTLALRREHRTEILVAAAEHGVDIEFESAEYAIVGFAVGLVGCDLTSDRILGDVVRAELDRLGPATVRFA